MTTNEIQGPRVAILFKEGGINLEKRADKLFGEVAYHGRKYTHVRLDNGEQWRFPPSYLDDKIEDKSVQMTADFNKKVMPVIANALEEVGWDEEVV